MDSNAFPFKSRLQNAGTTVTSTIRLLLALAGALIFVFWGAYRLAAPTAIDPLWGRVLFSLLPIGILLGSYTVRAIRERLLILWRFFLYATIAWFSGLTYLNGFAPSYSDGLLFAIVAACAGFSIGLDRQGPLLPFLGWTTGVPSVALWLNEASMVEQPVFLACVLSLPFCFSLILSLRVRMEHRRREQTRILERIARGVPLDELLANILTVVEDECPGLLGSVLLLNPTTKTLHHGAAPNLPEGYVDAIDGLEVGPNAGSCGTAAYQRETVVTEDIRTDERWDDYRSAALEHGLKACWSTPLCSSDGEVLGTFALYYTEPRSPTPHDLQLIEEASHLATVAIERNRQAEALKERKERFRLLAESMRDIVVLYNPDGSTQWVSPSIEDVLGWTPKELEEMEELELAHPTDREAARRHRDRIWNGNENVPPITYRARHKDGSYVWIETLARPILDGDGTPTLVQTTSRDVTDRVHRRKELKTAKEEAEEASRLKSAFLANMSHEIRTPLTSIIGFAEAIGEEIGQKIPGKALPSQGEIENIHQFTRLIEKSGRRLLETLNSVLDLSQLEAGSMNLHLEPIDATAEVEEAAELFACRAQEKGLNLHTKIDSPSLWVRADRGALQRILHNLLSNAVKFTEPGGSVTVRVREETDTVRFEVEDTGAGIDPDFLTHLFDAFKQESSGTARSHEGSGLGLTVTNQLVERLDGEIDVETELGVGTCFTVRLPQAKQTPVSEAET